MTLHKLQTPSNTNRNSPCKSFFEEPIIIKQNDSLNFPQARAILSMTRTNRKQSTRFDTEDRRENHVTRSVILDPLGRVETN